MKSAAAGLQGSILGFADDRGGSLWINAVDRVLRVDRAALLNDVLQHGDVRGAWRAGWPPRR